MTEKEFNKLIKKYQQGECTPDEEDLVDEFLESFQQDSLEWKQGIHGEKWSTQAGVFDRINRKINHYEQKRHLPWYRQPLWWVKIAAVIVGGFFIAYYWFTSSQTEPVIYNYIAKTNGPGQKSTFTLGDGTRVHLNAASTIQFPEVFHGSIREIELSGEAYFEVESNPAKPFIVKAKGVQTRVLGTSFNVNSYDSGRIAVTVTHGSVEVTGEQNDKKVVLGPRQQVVYRNGEEMIENELVNVEKYTGWRSGIIYFDKIDMAHAAKILERWYGVSIRFENEALKNCRILNKYTNQSLSNILESIKGNLDIDYSFQENDEVVLSGSGCN